MRTPKNPVDVDALTATYRAARTAHEAAIAAERAVRQDIQARHHARQDSAPISTDDRLAELDAEGDTLAAEQELSEAEARLVHARAQANPDAPWSLTRLHSALSSGYAAVDAENARHRAAMAELQTAMDTTMAEAQRAHELEAQSCIAAGLPAPHGIPHGAHLGETLQHLAARLTDGPRPRKSNGERIRRVRAAALEIRVRLEMELREREEKARREKLEAERARQVGAQEAAQREQAHREELARLAAEHAEKLEIARAYEARRTSVDRMISRRTAEAAK
ncbi:MAG TPA: hypothetical protein PLR99_00145 [Polyangiaceae bacterium]|nr:hypothetical protein [Polyangiaceae bacterium]